MLKKGTTAQYQQVAYGTWGRFNTRAGVIDFLGTKARLGSSSTGAETRLTRFLKPVREALNTREMDFNQLLQRDLDDHRVATELVPYLLKPNLTGPAFFPPIVAALLPFDGPKPLEDFPDRSDLPPREEADAWWSGYAFGEAFKFEKAVHDDGTPHPMSIGRLSWNDERAQIVVIDGQHRAMALLAVARTINKQWEGQGEKYKHFYENVVQDLLKGISPAEREEIFASIELPVTIVWFPESKEANHSHQQSARKLFVDVNKNARTPSASRLLLLSDAELSAILTRRILNTFRTENSDKLPITAIEYDHPEREQASSAKWSAISNVTIIHSCVYRAVFGPDKYISNLSATIRGKENETEGAKFMRASLQIGDVIPAVVGSLQREEIRNDKFPRDHIEDLESQFMKSWGLLIVRMLSDLDPFKAHGLALNELRAGWSGADSTGRLARDAIFEGVGMYWTLRDSHDHWRDTNKNLADSKLPQLQKTDVVNAWYETEQKRADFEGFRAKQYLGSGNTAATDASRGAYAIFSTHACQLGYVLAVRSLALLGNVPFADLEKFIDRIIEGTNAGIRGDAPGTFKRKVFLSRDVANPLNLIPKLDSPFAFYFRYFWLELLGSAEARPIVEEVVSRDLLDKCISESRAHYLDKVREIYRQSLQNGHPDWPKAKVAEEADQTARKELGKALKKWFGMTSEAFNAWLASLEPAPPAPETPEEPVEPTTDEPQGDEVEWGKEASPSVEELLQEEDDE